MGNLIARSYEKLLNAKPVTKQQSRLDISSDESISDKLKRKELCRLVNVTCFALTVPLLTSSQWGHASTTLPPVGNKKLPQLPRARGGMSGQEQQERMHAPERQ